MVQANLCQDVNKALENDNYLEKDARLERDN